MRFEQVLITKDIAEEYLSHNTHNRVVKKNIVQKYANDIQRGKWQEVPECVSFYEDGTLRDGQHRLLAIVRSGKPVLMWVCFDVPNNSNICDIGVKRSFVDILAIRGIAPDLINQTAGGCINFLLRNAGAGGNKNIITEIQKIEFAETYSVTLGEAVQLALSQPTGRQVARKAPIAAAFFCALANGMDSGIIARFVEVLNSGHQRDPSEDAAIALRNQILTDYQGHGHLIAQKAVFSITLQALDDFQKCKPRTRRYNTSVEHPYWKRVKAYFLPPFLGVMEK